MTYNLWRRIIIVPACPKSNTAFTIFVKLFALIMRCLWPTLHEVANIISICAMCRMSGRGREKIFFGGEERFFICQAKRRQSIF